MERTLASSRTTVPNRFLLRDFGKSIEFNGSSTVFTLPFTPSTTGISFAFWVKLKKLTSQQRIVAWVAGGPNGGFFVEKPTTGRFLKFDVYNGAGQQVDINTADLNIDEWCHVACTFKQNEAKIYLNAVLQATDTSCSMSVPAGQTLTIGRSSASAGQFFQGLLDQLIFQNTDTPWTQNQIEDLYYRGRIPSGATSITEGNDDVNDSSGNGNHGTLTNGTYSTDVTCAPRTQVSSRISALPDTRFNRMRGWNYSSNYLNGSSSNPWYVESTQIPYDMADIASAGMNVVKIYADENNAASHLAALDQVAAAGLKAVVLRFITYNTDYSRTTGQTNRTAAIAKFTGMITNLKSHPAIIGWGFGNENNYNLGTTPKYDWYALVEEAIQAGKAIDTSRFYFSANGEIADIAYGHDLVPSIDIWGANIYRGTTFSDLVADIQAATNKPLFLTEFGRKRPDNATQSQQTQADEIISLLAEAEAAFPTICGWVHFKYTHTRITDTGDEFWEVAAPLEQGVYQSRTKFTAYTAIQNYCTTHAYGQ